MSVLEDDFNIPEYLKPLMRDYLSKRLLLYDSTVRSRKSMITVGVQQGSMLSLDLWDALDDDFLRLDMPHRLCKRDAGIIVATDQQIS